VDEAGRGKPRPSESDLTGKGKTDEEGERVKKACSEKKSCTFPKTRQPKTFQRRELLAWNDKEQRETTIARG